MCSYNSVGTRAQYSLHSILILLEQRQGFSQVYAKQHTKHENSQLRMAISLVPSLRYFIMSKKHTQGYLSHAALAVRTIIDNLRSIESITSLEIFSSTPGLLHWHSVCGYLSRQIYYGE